MRFLLVLFGWFAIITSSLIILVPYFRRRRDLITTWSLFHVGCINFLGLASIQSGTSLGHRYTSPTDIDYLKFVAGGCLFYLVSIVTYHYFSWPTRFAGRVFTKWGPRTPKVLGLLFPVAMAGIVGFVFVPDVQLLGQLLSMCGRYVPIFTVGFCVVVWLNRPFNVFVIALCLIGMILAILTTNASFGRQDVLSLMITLPLCWYWVRARYYNPAHTLTVLSICAVLAGFVLTGVTLVRGIKTSPDLGVLEVAWEKLKAIPAALNSDKPGESIIGGDAVEASLATIRLYDRTQATQPFHALAYIVANPIPRAWWYDKPLALGYTLPIDIGWSSVHGVINLGPGIIGHGFHEGGLPMVVFYAFFFAALMRFFDAVLVRDPGNPYLIGLLGSFSGQLVAFTRGDIGLFSAQIVGAIGTCMVLVWLIRIFFGTERSPTDPMLQGFPVVMEGLDGSASFEGQLHGVQVDYLTAQPYQYNDMGE